MSFDLLAPHYRWIEAVAAGDKLQRCRTLLLGEVHPPQRVLVFGEGNGRFLVELLRRFPEAEVTVVELSGKMISLCRERLVRAGLHDRRVHFIQTDALTWQPPANRFDLIVTCFFLDCFSEDQLRGLIASIASAARPGATWLISDFQIAASGWRRWRSRIIVWLLYRFFRLVTQLPGRQLTDVSAMLRAAGFKRTQHAEMDWGLLYGDLWTLPATDEKTGTHEDVEH